MVKQVISFETSDGQKFATELEANGHEAGLQNKAVIEAYIVAAELNPEKAQAGFLRKHLAGFIAFEATYVAPTPAPAAAPATDAAPSSSQPQA